MSMIILPDFQHSKQSSQGREERMDFVIAEVKKTPIITLKGQHILKKDVVTWLLLKIQSIFV